MKTYHPQIKVMLIKVPNETGGLSELVDLTSYLGEHGGVRTSKSVKEPAGTFSITFADKIYTKDGKTLDSLYYETNPMDVVEIRFCHDSTKKNNGSLPIVMRGFVSEIRRDTAMGNDGKPSRNVVISGHDLGKLWQTLRVYYLNNSALGETVVTELRFLEKYTNGLAREKVSTFTDVSDFLSVMIDNILNPYSTKIMGNMKDVSDAGVKFNGKFTGLSTVVGTVSPYRINDFRDNSLYEILRTMLDVGPFNELFIEDKEDSSVVVVRPVPRKDLKGNIIDAGLDGGEVKSVDVLSAEIQSITQARSDANVANYFWLEPKTWSVVNDVDFRNITNLGSPGEVQTFEHANSLLAKYGFRKMSDTLSLGPPGLSIDGSTKQTAAETVTRDGLYMDWVLARLAILLACNKDNAVFESGSIKMSGNEAVRAGMYLNIKRGAGNHAGEFPSCYVVKVDHEFMPYQGFWTTVQYERGTGFFDRKKYPAYFAENYSGGAEG
jgi:hypothetical protein